MAETEVRGPSEQPIAMSTSVAAESRPPPHTNGGSIDLFTALDDDGILDEAAFSAVEAELIETERWIDLASLYALGAERAPEGEVGLRMLLSAGLLWHEKLGDDRKAEPYLRRVLALDPDSIDALDGLLTICFNAGRFDEAADLLDHSIEVSHEQDKPDLLVTVAEVVHGKLRQVDRALAALRYAYELDPARLDVLRRAREIFIREERWIDAKRVLDDEARAVLGDVLDVAPGTIPVSAPKAPALPEGQQIGDTTFISMNTGDLTPDLEAAGQPREIAKVETDGDAAKQIAEAYRQLGVHLLGHASLHKVAEQCLVRARQLGDEEALSKLDELAHLRKDWEVRAAMYRDEGFEARDKRRAAQFYLRAAELYHEYGRDPIRAEEYLDRCLILSPGYPPALRFIETARQDPDKRQDLIKKLNGISTGVKDPAVKAEILLRVAQLLEAEASEAKTEEQVDIEGIVNAYRRALAIQPGHRDSVVRLDQVLEGAGRHADRAQMLEGQLAAVNDEYLKTITHVELGRIYAELLGDSERSRNHFEAVLAVSPTHFGAASALRALYKDAQEQPLLLGVLKVLVDYSPDLFSRLEMLSQMREVAREVSREEEFNICRLIFEIDPHAGGVRQRLEELAAELGRWKALADTLVVTADRKRGEKAAELYGAAGKIYDEKLPRPGDAIRAFKKALELRPTDVALHDILERLLRQSDDPAALVEVLKSQLARNQDPDKEPILMAKIGDVLDRELGDLNAAIEMFNRVLEKSPNNGPALNSLDDLYRRNGDFEKQAQILARRETTAENPTDLADLQVRRARVLDERLNKKEQAAEIYLEVLAKNLDHGEVVEALSRLASQGVLQFNVARALEPIYAQQGEAARQLEMLEMIVDHGNDPAERKAAAFKAAVLGEHRLNDPAAALRAWAKALMLDPASEEARNALLRLATATDQLATATGTIENILSRYQLARDVISQLASSLGELYDGPVNDKAKAIEMYRRAVDADGSNASAITQLSRLLGAESRFEELTKLLEERIYRSDEKAAKIQLGLSLASIREQHLSDVEGAIKAYRDVLALEPKEATALSKLAEALEKLGRHRELIAVLDRMRDASDQAIFKAATEVKVGDVLTEKLNEPKEAVPRYKRALDLVSLNQGAILGLEALLSEKDLRVEVGRVLIPCYSELGRHRDLVMVLETQLVPALAPDRKKQIYYQIAETEEHHLDQPEAAFDTLARAAREGLISPEERPRLTALALKANRAKSLAQLYEDLLAQAKDDLALDRELARLYDGAAADPGRAEQAFKRVLEKLPNDPEALEALERLTAAGDDPTALAEVLLKRAYAAAEKTEKVAFLKRASAIYEEAVEDLDQAIQSMEDAKEIAPDDRSTWQELQRLYGLAGDKERVRDALAAEGDLIEEPLQRANVRVKLAELLVELNEADRAIDEFSKSLAAMPEHRAAREGLEKLMVRPQVGPKAAQALEPVYRAAGDWTHLVEAYEILAAASEDPVERVERLVAIRSIYEERLGRVDKAFQAAARAFREAPDNDEVLQALEHLGKMSGQIDEFLGILEDQADALPYVSEERHAVRVKIARATENLVSQRGRVIDSWKRVLEERPDSVVALNALEVAYRRGGEARELVEVLRTMAGVLNDTNERTSKLRQAAQILDEKLGDRAGAARIYEQVIMLDPKEREALTRLDAIYTRARAHEELARILEAEAIAAEGEDKARFMLRLGQLKRSSLEDPRGALKAYAGILVVADDTSTAYEGAVVAVDELIDALKVKQPELVAEAASLIEQHWVKKGMPLKVVAAKEARIAAATEPDSRRKLLLEISGLYEKELAQPEMAFLALTRAYSETPNDLELANELERLASSADTEEELADLYAQVLPSIEDPEMALRLARRTAHIYDHVLGRGENAVPYYNKILGLVQDDTSALTALERIHRRAGNATSLVEVYRGMLRLAADDTNQQKELWNQIADIMESDLEDDDGAFEAYGEMLVLAPSDMAVIKKMSALCERSGRLEDLAVMYLKHASLTEVPDDKAQVLLKLGTLRKDRLEDSIGAVEAFSHVLELRPRDPGAISGLSAILREDMGPGSAKSAAARTLGAVYQKSGAFEEYIVCLQAQVESSRSPEERKELLAEIAEVYEQRLGRPEHAFTYACRALKEDLSNEVIRAQAERLSKENGVQEELAAFYLDVVDTVTDHDLAVHLRRRVAQIYDHDLQDTQRAIAEYNKILDVAPGDPEGLQALERLYKKAGSFGSLADVYRRRIAQAEDDGARVRLMREFARLQANELADAPGGIATLRRLLEIEPNDVDALSRLAKLCKQQGRASELADVLERLIDAAPEGSEELLDAKYDLAKLKAERLGDLAGADKLLEEVLTANPTHEAGRELLQERFEDAVAEEHRELVQSTGEILATAMRKAEQWSELISVLRMRADLAATHHERVPINREIADIYRDKLEQPELAFNTLAQVYQDAPGMGDARAELERLAEQLLYYEELVDVFESSLVEIRDPELAKQIEKRVAELTEEKLGDRERAGDAWRRVLEREPLDAKALESLDRLNQHLGLWAAQTDVLEKRIQLATDLQEQHGLMVRLAAIWDERLQEREEAISWYRKAQEIDPEDKETLTALSLLLDQETQASELFEVLRALSAHHQPGRDQIRLLTRMAELAGGPLDKAGNGIAIWKQVLEQDPQNQSAKKGLEELFEKEGRWKELAELLEKQLEQARSDKELIRLQRRLGLIKGTRLGSTDEAIRAWGEILKRNPNDLEALQALRQIHRDASRWEDLISTLRKLIPLQLEASGVKEIRFELAEVFLSKINQREEAIESAKRVLDVEPHTVAELMRLEEIFVQTGAFGEAVKVMNERADQSESPGERIEILFEIARIYEEKIHRKAGAGAAYEKILVLEPTSGKAYEALSTIYEQNGDYRKLVELINKRLEITEEAVERRKLLFRIIDIQERWLGHPELAFTAACRAFAEEGADESAQTIAERLAEETDNWEILAEVYLEHVDQVGVSRQIDLRKRLGEIYLSKLQQPEEAEEQLSLVLSLRPEDQGARDLLLGILEKEGRWQDGIAQLTDKVELAATAEEKKQLYKTIAQIQEQKLGDIEAAVATVKRILDLDATDVGALNDLARIFRTAEKWHPLLNVLSRRLELAENQAERVRIRFEVAGVWEQGIEDLREAVDAYKDVLALDETYRPALSALEQLYTVQHRWSDLIEIYERQVELAEEAPDAIGVLSRIANIWEEQFRDLPAASQTLIRVLEIDPEHLPTVKALERIWRESEDWQHLIEALHRHIELARDPHEMVALYLEAGQIYLERLDKVEKAEEVLTAALDADPSSREAVHALGQLHEQAGNWFNALEMLQREANLLGSSPEAVELHFRMGKINEEMLMELPAAQENYLQALEIDPSYSPAIRSLRAIYQKEQNWAEVIALTAQEAQYSVDDTEKAELYQKAADLSLERFDDVDRAVRFFEQSLAAEPYHISSLRTLSDLYYADEKWDAAEKLLERLVEKLDKNEDKDELCKNFYRLAYIAEKLGDDHQALKRYLSSYEFDSTYLPTLEGLAAALLRAERWEDAQRILQTILIQHKSSLTDAEVVDLYFQLGELATKLSQHERAAKNYKKALDLDPDHVPTLRSYSEVAEQLEEWEDAYDRRERLIALLDGDERFEQLVKQANLCRDKIKEPYRAIDAYSEAKRIRPDDLRVLRALVRLFAETSQAPRTIEVLNDLASVLTDQDERRDVYMDLARAWAEQKDVAKAVDHLNKALDVDPMFVKAFQMVEQILFEQKHWQALEANYHRMIKRMPQDQKKARAVLWKSLGDLYLKVLKNTEGAKLAYEVVLNKLEPDSTDVGLSLAEIYAAKQDSAPKAVALYHRLLETSDDPAIPTRKLFELYHALGKLDRAFCSLGSLILMRAANEMEVQAYQMLLKRVPAAAQRALTDNLWRKNVLHPACRNSLADICSILYRGAPELFSEGQRALALKKKEKVDLDDKGKNARVRLRYFDIWSRLSGAMHVGEMEHFHRPGVAHAPRLYPGAPPVMFAGEQHEAFKTMPPRQIAWMVARQMAAARPELAAVRSLPPDEVGAAIEAAILMFSPEGSGVDLNLDQKLVQNWKKNLQRYLVERAVRALRDPVVQCLEQREMRHLARFLEGAEHTCSRAALLMSQDVAAAERGLGESDQLVDVSFRARVRALMLFTLSEDHFILREKLGLAIA